MKVSAIKTNKVQARAQTLEQFLDASLKKMPESSVLAVSSKVISLCEGRVAPIAGSNKEDLIMREADKYLLSSFTSHGYHFTIINNTLVAAAGIDESNGDNHYVLWPKDAQATANEIRSYLKKRFGLQNVGLVVTDSISTPLRRGASGVALAHSGFSALNNYVGKPDLFNRPITVSQANVAGGLAASAVLAMGEGSEQTPLCIIENVPFVAFQDRNPTPEELKGVYLSIDDDLFGSFLSLAPWE